jgi:hypothetical protein
MKEIKRMKIDKSEFNQFNLSELTVNQLFDVNINKGEKVVTSVS